MKFIDTHCHFDFPPFEGDISGSLARAAEAGVERLSFRRSMPAALSGSAR